MDAENLYYFEKAPVTKAVAHFAVPMMLGMSMSVIYSILNAYFLGTLHNTAMFDCARLNLAVIRDHNGTGKFYWHGQWYIYLPFAG